MSVEPICPCDGFEHPATPANGPGLGRVRYRVGDFRTFRRALLRPLPGEAELTAWRPNAQGDLLLQIFEWWSYVADVLTFYNERSLNENLLATASLDESVRRLVRVLGYRPRPGIGGSAVLGVLLSGPRPVALPQGFRVESKPAPGKEPQTFETSAAATLSMPDAVSAEPPGTLAGTDRGLYLEGSDSSIQPGDIFLLAAAGTQQNALLLTVQEVTQAKDAAGRPYTKVRPAGSPSMPVADASAYRLLRSNRVSGLWKYPTTIPLVSPPLELEGVDRAVGAGQVMVLTAPGTSLAPALLNVNGTTEEIWYTNGDAWSPPAAPTIPSGAPHTRINWSASGVSSGLWNPEHAKVRVLLDWQPFGKLRNVPAATYSGTPPVLVATAGGRFRTGGGQTVLIEDAEGAGVQATASVSASTPDRLQIASINVTPPPTLKPPLRVLQDVIRLTRGKTVEVEILGVGNAAVAGQEFVLKKSPLTYLPAGASIQSTLRIYVDGVQWAEAPSFYGQPGDATIFVTYEDDDRKTHVQFGDWTNGAGLPTGAVVRADYRIGSGGDDLAPDLLTIVARPVPGLRAVRQPTLAGGGSDPDPREQIRRYAPRSVLTFGRAISADDYEAIASRAPGVARVKSTFVWIAQEQRAGVTLYVGDTPAAVASARDALLASGDPNRPVTVLAATAVPLALLMIVRIETGRVIAEVIAGVRSRLADPEAGLLGARRTGIGETFYDSQVSAACLEVAGVRAVRFLFFLGRPDPVTGSDLGQPPRINASTHEFFALAPEWVFISPEVTGA